MKGFYPTIVDDILPHIRQNMPHIHTILRSKQTEEYNNDAFEGDHMPSIIGFYKGCSQRTAF
jgi:hypothetical protein